jgi:hypothetical protein
MHTGTPQKISEIAVINFDDVMLQVAKVDKHNQKSMLSVRDPAPLLTVIRRSDVIR